MKRVLKVAMMIPYTWGSVFVECRESGGSLLWFYGIRGFIFSKKTIALVG